MGFAGGIISAGGRKVQQRDREKKAINEEFKPGLIYLEVASSPCAQHDPEVGFQDSGCDIIC